MTVNLLSLRVSGIIGFYHPTKKKIYIAASKSLAHYCLSIAYHIDIEHQIPDPEFVEDWKAGALEILVLEDVGYRDSFTLNLSKRRHEELYESQGVEFYSHYKRAPRYYPRIRATRKGNKFFFHVLTQTKRYSDNTVAVFESHTEAKAWVDEFYPDGGPLDFIICATNQLTRDYLS